MVYKTLLLMVMVIIHHVLTSNIPEKFLINLRENKGTRDNTNGNKTVQKLVQDQTDIIKKIISDEKEKLINSTSRKPQTQIESIEDLRIKCQKLNSGKGTEKTQIDDQQPVSSTTQVPNSVVPTASPLNYFYVTRNVSQPMINQFYPYQYTNSQKNNLELNTNLIGTFTSRHGLQPLPRYPTYNLNGANFSPNVRYVQLEPVILQKMVLNDGKELLYWYKAQDVNSQYHPIYNQPSISVSDALPQSTPVFDTTTPVPSTTQKPSQPNPHYDVEYSHMEKEQPTKQMKFVIPIQYPANEGAEISKRYPWEFDPYAYYPKPLQPFAVRVPIPYVPMFHMIRTLTIPGSNQNAN